MMRQKKIGGGEISVAVCYSCDLKRNTTAHPVTAPLCPPDRDPGLGLGVAAPTCPAHVVPGVGQAWLADCSAGNSRSAAVITPPVHLCEAQHLHVNTLLTSG